MNKSKSKGQASEKARADVVTVEGKPGEDGAALIARCYLQPTVQGASTIRAYNKANDGSGPELNALIGELQKEIETVSGGDLKRTEAMLLAQAHSLDAIFGNLARRAAVQEYLPQFEAHLKLALKAQSQCRATLETLALIKNPQPVAFVRQANIAAGPQQVNNVPQPEIQHLASRTIHNEPQTKILDPC